MQSRGPICIVFLGERCSTYEQPASKYANLHSAQPPNNQISHATTRSHDSLNHHSFQSFPEGKKLPPRFPRHGSLGIDLSLVSLRREEKSLARILAVNPRDKRDERDKVSIPIYTVHGRPASGAKENSRPLAVLAGPEELPLARRPAYVHGQQQR